MICSVVCLVRFIERTSCPGIRPGGILSITLAQFEGGRPQVYESVGGDKWLPAKIEVNETHLKLSVKREWEGREVVTTPLEEVTNLSWRDLSASSAALESAMTSATSVFFGMMLFSFFVPTARERLFEQPWPLTAATWLSASALAYAFVYCKARLQRSDSAELKLTISNSPRCLRFSPSDASLLRAALPRELALN